MMKPLMAALLLLVILPVQAAEWQTVPAITALFASAQLDGTFVVYDPDAQRLRGHDQVRAETRFVPASTFKIANSLIGLSVGAVSSVDEVIPYTGEAEPFIKAWARDMGLRDAMPLSNVPIYQELARRITLPRMQEALQQLHYGNADTGTVVDRFWLEGPLAISAVEQARFLARLARQQLPLPHNVQLAVRDILLLERGDDWRLYGKTGWQNAPGAGVGWWVGWVEQGDRVQAFALNIDIKTPPDANQRIALGKASLQQLGLLPLP